jgi:predicted alpha/beta-hydrolase family hydrolase
MAEIETPHGVARAQLHPVEGARAALVLGHGAGGGIGARDLLTATAAARARGVSVALVEQPYRVAGRRSPAPARQLDAAWIAVCERLRDRGPLAGLAQLTGGRSSGARVACRTARATGAAGVLCLAFPLLAPARRDGERPSRLPELDGAGVPVLVVQGASDRFGIPPAADGRGVVVIRGDHALRGDLPALATAVEDWLAGLLSD